MFWTDSGVHDVCEERSRRGLDANSVSRVSKSLPNSTTVFLHGAYFLQIDWVDVIRGHE